MANGVYERQGVISKDGYGFAGNSTEFNTPPIEEVMQEHNAGGTGGTLEIPMGRVSNMEATWTLKTAHADAYKATHRNNVGIKYRASAVDEDGNEVPIRYELWGRITRREESGKTPDGESTITERMHVTAYKKYVNNEMVTEIDIKALVFKPDGGEDIWSGMRKSLGM